MRYSLSLGLATTAVILLSCAVAADDAPYRVERSFVRQRIHKVALEPLQLPSTTEDPERVRLCMEQAIASQLAKLGYQVIGSESYKEIWGRMASTTGGVFDPLTGQRNDSRYGVVREHVLHELAEASGAEAILASQVVIEAASPALSGIFDDLTLWGDKITARGKPIPANYMNIPQRVVATYLQVSMADITGLEVYRYSGGIEWFRVYYGGGYEQRADDDRYSTVACARGAQAALGKLEGATQERN